jgi:hypothetical protein
MKVSFNFIEEKIFPLVLRECKIFKERVILNAAPFPFETHPTDDRVKMLHSLLRVSGFEEQIALLRMTSQSKSKKQFLEASIRKNKC